MKLNKLSDFRIWSFISFTYLLLITLIGVYLRLIFISDFGGLKFTYLLHSHSHTAMLGWVYGAIYTLIVSLIASTDSISFKKYIIVFLLIQLVTVGMLISFAATGYSIISVIFSSLHIILSYAFIIYILKDIRKDYFNAFRNGLAYKFIISSLFFLVLATLAPWFLGILASKGLNSSEIYTQTIYFYLHFIYNGFFTFALLGLCINEIDKSYEYDRKKTNLGFYLLFFSTFTSYSVSLLGFKLNIAIRFIAILSAFIQLSALWYLYMGCYSAFKKKIYDSQEKKILFWIFLVSLLFKQLLQFLSTLLFSGNIAFHTREIPIGYIHLVMLGFISCGLFLLLSNKHYLFLDNLISKTGIIIFVSGFILNEVLLFSISAIFWFGVKGFPGYNIMLFISSALMLIGFALMWINNIKFLKKKNDEGKNICS